MSERVLVIDFDRRECQRLAQELRDRGYEVSTATSGAEFRERLSHGQPGLVLLDPMLPGEDGFKLCRELKRPDRKNPPKIVVASRIYKGQRYRTDAERAGADVFLERPRQDKEILPAIERLLPVRAAPEPEPLEMGAPEIVLDASSMAEPPEPTEVDPPPGDPDPPRETDGHTAASQPAAGSAEPRPPARVAEAPAASSPPQKPAATRAPAATQPPAGGEEAPSAPEAGGSGQGFAEVTDDDIDNALERALGGGDGGGLFASGAFRVPEPEPSAGGTVSTAPHRARPADPPAQAPAASTAAPNSPRTRQSSREGEADHLSQALDGLGIEVAASDPQQQGTSRRTPRKAAPAEAAPAEASPEEPQASVSVLDNPMSFDPPATSGAAIERRGDPGGPDGLELQTGQHTGGTESEPRENAAPDEQPVEPLAASTDAPATPSSPPEPDAPATPSSPPEPDAPRAEGGDDLDVMLDRAFAGTGPEEEPPASEPVAASVDEDGGPPPFPAPEPSPVPSRVPDSLRGMDEGTADLLSSLEELHSSLPGGAEGGESSEWTSSGLTEDVTLNTEQPRTEAPTPEEEASLDDVVEQLTGSAEYSAPQPAAGTPDAEHAEAPAADEAGSAGAEPAEEKQPDPPPRRKRRISLGWLMSFFIGLVSVGVSGSLLWFGEGETGPPASASSAVASIAAEDDADGSYGPVAPGPAGASEKGASERAGRAAGPSEERSIRRIPGDEGSEPSDDLDSTPALGVASRGEEVVGESGDTEPPAPPRPRPTPARASLGGDAPTDGGSAAPAAIRPEPRPASASSSEGESAAAADGDGSDAGAEQADRAAAGGERPSPGTAMRNAAEPGPARTRSAAQGDSGDAGPAQEAPEPNPSGGDSGRTQPIPIVGLRDLDRPLELIESPTPRLAPEAEEKGISGRVFVNLLIGPDGKVRDVRVMINPGYGLGQAAREAASRWSYTVPTRHGRPVRVWKTEVVEFETAGS